MASRPDITPELKVAKLLDAYPELMDTLVGFAPAFVKLKNPVLRRTVAKVTSLRQAAVVGGVPVGELVRALRDAAGLDPVGAGGDPEPATPPEPKPEWVDRLTLLETFDARPMIEAGDMPMAQIMATVGRLESEQKLVFVAPFTPAPLLDRLRQAGYRVWTERVADDEHRTHCALGA